jgi:hypothetical protein
VTNTTQIATTAFVKAQPFAPLADPVFTGDPKAPTPLTADNDTSIATTAFVKVQGYATATYVDTQDALRVLKAGDTMTGPLVAPSFATPVADASFVKVSHTSFNAGADPYNFTSNAITRFKLDNLGRMHVNPAFVGSVGMDTAYAMSVTKDSTYGGIIVNAGQPGAAANGHFFVANGSGALVFYVGYGGGIFSTSSSVSVISDANYKSDVVDLPYGLDDILKLRPIMYRLDLPNDPDRPMQYGFTAQEVQPIFPELVTTGEVLMREGEELPLMLAEGSILIPLVKAVQELAARVAQLEAAAA